MENPFSKLNLSPSEVDMILSKASGKKGIVYDEHGKFLFAVPDVDILANFIAIALS